MLVCAIFAQFGTRDRGCSAHPAFPAPSVSRVRTKNLHHSGENTPRERGRTFSPHVVPANAGTHTPRRMLLWCAGRRLCFNNCRLGLWAPAFAGATVREDS